MGGLSEIRVANRGIGRHNLIGYTCNHVPVDNGAESRKFRYVTADKIRNCTPVFRALVETSDIVQSFF